MKQGKETDFTQRPSKLNGCEGCLGVADQCGQVKLSVLGSAKAGRIWNWAVREASCTGSSTLAQPTCRGRELHCSFACVGDSDAASTSLEAVMRQAAMLQRRDRDSGKERACKSNFQFPNKDGFSFR